MEQELISKKELLETYGISYGTLYRWQRTGLIPKEWFIRKSTPTGQETFFPKELIIERVNYIFLEKDGMSLEELAARVSKKEENAPMLIIETKYEKKQFPLDDIKNISISGSGKILGISEIIEILKNSEAEK